jgi:ABC-2 type transport system permease protein
MNNLFFDIGLVIRKEWKEIFLQRGGLRGGFFNLAIMLFLLGVMMPLQSGPEWLRNPLIPLAWSWMPVMLTMNMVVDAFAGERERHTLETLLSSRLSGRAIVLGKLFAAVLYGWIVAEGGILLATITINLANPGSAWIFYPPVIFFGCLLLPLLASAWMAGLGILISLRASSVRQASQQLSIALMAFFVLPMFGLQFMPSTWQAQALAWLSAIGPQWVFILGGLALLVIDLSLIVAAVGRFQRTAIVE